MKNKVQKKSKSEKISKLDKIPEYLSSHQYVLLIENTDINSSLIQRMRSELPNTKILFCKKSLLLTKYKINAPDKNFFLVFTDQNGIEEIKKYEYDTYLEVNDVSTKDITIKSGQIKNKELGELLPTITESNITILDEDYKVCSEGEVVDEKAVRILRILGHKLKKENIKILEIIESKDFK